MTAPVDPPAPAQPATGLVVALGALGAALGVLVTGIGWATPPFVVFGMALGALAAHDAATMRIPNRILYPAAAATSGLLVLTAVVSGGPLGRAALGAVAAFGLLLVVAAAAPAGMGMGDVKLAALVGLVLGWVGWGPLWVALLLAFVANAVFGLAVRHRSGRRVVALAPFVAAAAAVVLAADCGVGGCG